MQQPVISLTVDTNAKIIPDIIETRRSDSLKCVAFIVRLSICADHATLVSYFRKVYSIDHQTQIYSLQLEKYYLGLNLAAKKYDDRHHLYQSFIQFFE